MKPIWNDAEIFDINTEKRNCAGFPLYGEKGVVSLDGKWKFLFCESVLDAPKFFYKTDADLKNFRDIDVPSEWQIKGYGTPIYSNTAYPYALESKNKFKIPFVYGEKNPTGLYVRDFELGGELFEGGKGGEREVLNSGSEGKREFLCAGKEIRQTAFCVEKGGEREVLNSVNEKNDGENGADSVLLNSVNDGKQWALSSEKGERRSVSYGADGGCEGQGALNSVKERGQCVLNAANGARSGVSCAVRVEDGRGVLDALGGECGGLGALYAEKEIEQGALNSGQDIGQGTLNSEKEIGQGALNSGQDIGQGTLNSGKEIEQGALNSGKRERPKRNIFINFGGINSAGEVFVNGRFVGFSADTFSETEFDITDFVKKGRNRLAVRVYQYTAASYLEDQDMWRLAGIFRGVNLIFRPRTEIRDFFVRSKLANDFKSAVFQFDAEIETRRAVFSGGSLKLEIIGENGETAAERDYIIDKIGREKAASGCKIEIGTEGKTAGERDYIIDKTGREKAASGCKIEIGAEGKTAEERDYIIDKIGEKRTVSDYEIEVVNPALWSHENPRLYTVVFTLFEGGKIIDRRARKFGFRGVEIVGIKDGKGPFILLNGKPLNICGVNRHDFHPEYGHAVPKEVAREDLLLMKRNNITSVRTCHYPAARSFYEMCDELGLLVMSECNLETHGLAKYIPRNSEKWLAHCNYRLKNMVESFKNHPSVIFWSLGNESGTGRVFSEMKKTLLNIDTTRPVHYEPDNTMKVSDMLSEMYAPLGKMPKIGKGKAIVHSRALWNNMAGYYFPAKKYENKPFIQCEYSHAMGNSLGNFADYQREFEKYDRLAGGYIWDFADQAIMRYDRLGNKEYCYGGDFFDKPNYGVFAFNGIVRADRSPNPALYEVKAVYARVGIEYVKGAENGRENETENDGSIPRKNGERGNASERVLDGENFGNGAENGGFVPRKNGGAEGVFAGGVIRLKNKFMFTNLNKFSLSVSECADGVLKNRAVVPIPSVEPGGEKEIEMPFVPSAEKGKEICLTFEVLTNRDTPYAKKGHVIAAAQALTGDVNTAVKENAAAAQALTGNGKGAENTDGFGKFQDAGFDGKRTGTGGKSGGAGAEVYDGGRFIEICGGAFCKESANAESGEKTDISNSETGGKTSGFNAGNGGTIPRKNGEKTDILNSAIKAESRIFNLEREKGTDALNSGNDESENAENGGENARISGGSENAKGTENGGTIPRKNKEFSILFDKKSGAVASYMKRGRELLYEPITPNFWRAPIDNDTVLQVPVLSKIFDFQRYKKAMKKMKPSSAAILTAENGTVEIHIKWKMPNLLRFNTVYSVRQDGTLNLSMSVVPIVNLIRFGFKFALNDGIENMKFYGKGPHENYVDRNTSALLGLYEGGAEDFIHGYLHPQENGNHTGMRNLKITDGTGFGVGIRMRGKPFEASVHPYSAEMLEKAKHDNELFRLPNLRVYVDGGQRGVGGDIPALALLKKPYKLPHFKEHAFSVDFVPIVGGNGEEKTGEL
ncbi:MAG: DUF4981 domain-containing protein [Clostridiales bacterium]|jgi:beta-galactosidase/beta-glucuronidase|nr:DUF4981 domain-containing protein [Clostridiales bacterium]